MSRTAKLLFIMMVVGTLFLAVPQRADADPTFGVSLGSPSGLPGDGLEPAPGAPTVGPLAPPAVVIPVGLLPPPGEVDATSFGDEPLPPGPMPWHVAFSVSPGSLGHPASPPFPPHPNVFFEGPVPGIGDGSTPGDIYESFDPLFPPFGGFPPFVPPPCGPVRSNTQLADENGLGPLAFGAPNVGLGLLPFADNLDTLDLSDSTVVDFLPPGGDGVPDVPVFFSVDPLTAAGLVGVPPNFSPPSAATIYAYFPGGGPPTIFDYIPFFALGLAPGDDIDALALAYSGAPVTVPGAGFGNPVMYSLAPGSPSLAVLPSACFGPGTATGGDLFGGPGIPFPVVDAEMLGLSTIRSGALPPVNDNVDAIDICLEAGADADFDLQDNGCDFDDDGDLVGDSIDNCPTVSNPTQANNDAPGGPFGGTQAWINDGIAPEGSTTGGDVCDPNDDNNGCTDVQEGGASHVLGGQRNPMNPWDFGDMWVPSLPMAGSRSGAVNINDVIAILNWIGAANNGPPNASGRDYDSGTNANGVEDGAEYDRSPSTTPGQPWRLNPPSGAVAINDAIAVLNSVGDHC